MFLTDQFSVHDGSLQFDMTHRLYSNAFSFPQRNLFQRGDLSSMFRLNQYRECVLLTEF